MITRSQARNVEESGLDPDQGPKLDTEEPDKEMERKPRKRRQRTKRSKSKKSQENVPTPPKEDVVSNPIIHPESPDNLVISETSSGGLVLVEKVNESLEAIKRDYESRVTALTEIPPKLREYPNPREEKVNLAVHQQRIRETQALLECPPKPIERGPRPFKATLEPISEVSLGMENEGEGLAPADLVSRDKLTKNADLGDTVPEIEEAIAREMWEAVRQKAEDASSSKTPPFSIVDFSGKEHIDPQTLPYKGDLDSESSFPSKQTLKTLPSYLGKYEPKSVILKVPSMWSAQRKEVDTANLHALMSTPVTCTLPLTDLLKIKPELWEYVAKCLTEHGLWNKKFSLEEALDTKTRLSRKSVRTAVPVN